MVLKKILIVWIMLVFACGMGAQEEADGGALREKIQGIIIEKLEFDNVPAGKAIAMLQDLGKKNDPENKGIKIFFSGSARDKKKQPLISMSETGISLEEALDNICSIGGLEYKIEAKRVVVTMLPQSGDVHEQSTEPVKEKKPKGKVQSNDSADSAEEKSPAPVTVNAKKPKTATNKVQNVNVVDTSEVTKCLVSVDGDKKKYSGFIANINGKKTIVTDIHALLENSTFSFRDINNNKVMTNAIYLSTDREILLAEIAEGTDVPALELEPDLSGVQQNTGITVGKGAKSDKFLGTDVKTIELKAKFSEKESGCPIVSNASGKVIGIAAYIPAKVDETAKKGTSAAKPQMLGYRIDNIKNDELQAFDANKYRNDLNKYKALAGIHNMGEGLMKELEKSIPKSGTGHFKEINVGILEDSPEIKKIAEEWNSRVEDYNESLKKAGSSSSGNSGKSDENKSGTSSGSGSSSKTSGNKTTNGTTKSTAKKNTMPEADTNSGNGKTMIDAQGGNFRNILSKMKKSLETHISRAQEGSFNYRYISKEAEKYTLELDSITKEMDSYMDKLEKNTKDSKKGYKL